MLRITLRTVKLILSESSVRVTTLLNTECLMLQRLTQEEMKAIYLETVDNMQEIRRIARNIE